MTLSSELRLADQGTDLAAHRKTDSCLAWTFALHSPSSATGPSAPSVAPSTPSSEFPTTTHTPNGLSA